MKVLMLNGSPHRSGCTDRALREVQSVLEQNGIETEIFWIGREAVAGCIGCGACSGGKPCFRNDAVNGFVEKAREADGFVFGTPVHYAAASGAVTSFLDRCFYCGKTAFAHKPGACVVSARRAGTTAAFDQMNKYLTISQMIVVSSQYWNNVHGNTPEEVEKDQEGLQIMRTLGCNMAWLLRCIEAGKKAGLQPPESEPWIGTNFIR